MSKEYQILIDLDAIYELPKKRIEKEYLLNFLSSLRSLHHEGGDYQEASIIEPFEYEVSVVESYFISWWVDHPVKRALILDIRNI